MITIYKYPIRIDDVCIVQMPKGAEVLTAQMQSGTLCLWAKVDSDRQTENRVFNVFGTGHPIDDAPRQYIGTVQVHIGAPLVFHVFERIVAEAGTESA